jgi:hypothetical protein
MLNLNWTFYVPLTLPFKDMNIDEGQDVVEEEIEAKKVAVRSRSRIHSRSRSRFYNNI